MKKAGLSKKAKSNMNNCFRWLHMISNYKRVYSKAENKTFSFLFSFITLTLSDVQHHSDDYIKSHMLEPFLKWMSRSWSAHSYIWKAEAQNNGNIHFHITTNKFIHWKSIRTKWNRLLQAHQYCKVYQDGTNDKGDSATEVRAVRNNNEISKYIAAYSSKKDLFKSLKDKVTRKKQYIFSEACTLNNHFYMKENFRQMICSDGMVREYKRLIHGRLWGASVNLNQSACIINELNAAYQETEQVLKHDELTDKKYFDYSTVYLYKKKIWPYLPYTIKSYYNEKIHALKSVDEPQYKITIETFY
jgi:hypothetical protein